MPRRSAVDTMKTPEHDNPGRKKIFETFFRFAAPILVAMPDGASPSEIENALRVPYIIWNALVFDHASGTHDYLTRVRETIAHSHPAIAITEDLIDRKRRLFADDNFLIGNYRVTKLGPGEINLRVEARDPYSAIEQQDKANNPMVGD